MRIEKLKKQFIARGAPESEMRQLEEIENIIIQDKLKDYN